MTRQTTPSSTRSPSRSATTAMIIERNTQAARQLRAQHTVAILQDVATAIRRTAARATANAAAALSKLRPGAITFRRNRAGQPC